MERHDEVVQRLLLAAPRAGHQEAAVTPSQVARASGRTPDEAHAFLDWLVDQGALRRAAYLLADCPCCRSPLRVPAPVRVGYAPTAPPTPLRLAAIWCPICQQIRSSGEVRIEPAYTSPPAAFGAAE